MLTPVDIEMKEFRRAKFGGYHTDDVNDFLDDVIESFEELHRHNLELKNKIILLNESISYYKSMEETLQSTLVLAEKTAQDTKAVAYQESDQIIREGKYKSEKMINDAEQQVYHIQRKIDELTKHFNIVKVKIKQMLNSQLEIIESQDLLVEDSEVNTQYTNTKANTKEKSYTDEEESYTKEYKIVNEDDAI